MDISPNDLPAGSRYREVTRRRFLRTAAQAAGVAAIVPLLSACGEDASVFATTSTAPASSDTPASTTTTTTAAPESTTTLAPTTEAASASDSLISGEAVIAFTYTADSASGQVRNPYVAVWIEDADGELVNTIAVWYLQSQKGLRWINDLRRWYSVDGSSATLDAVSSATRRPGDYTVAWDLTSDDGLPVARGEYYVCIEAAREHGPYSLIREAVTLEAGMGSITLAEDGELRDASFSVSA